MLYARRSARGDALRAAATIFINGTPADAAVAGRTDETAGAASGEAREARSVFLKRAARRPVIRRRCSKVTGYGCSPGERSGASAAASPSASRAASLVASRRRWRDRLAAAQRHERDEGVARTFSLAGGGAPAATARRHARVPRA